MVLVSKQKDEVKKERIEVQINVQTQWADVSNNLSFRTIAVAVPDQRMIKMVVRWHNSKSGPESVFANHFDKISGNYACFMNNSTEFEEEVLIHNSRICAVDYISLIQV